MADELRCGSLNLDGATVVWGTPAPLNRTDLAPYIEEINDWVTELCTLAAIPDDDQLFESFMWVRDMTLTFQLSDISADAALQLLGDEVWAAWNFMLDGGDIDSILEVESAYSVTFE